MDVEMEPFRRAIQRADEWTNEVKWELGASDLQHAWAALGAVLHSLRDRLTLVEAAELGTQLPLLVRGLYFAGWDPARREGKDPRKEAFLKEIREYFPEQQVDAARVARAVFSVLDAHVSPAELEEVRGLLPKSVRELWLSPRTDVSSARSVPHATETRTIDRKEWGPFLASLSERMRERPVELSVESLALGDQRIARLPLVGISTETKDPQDTAIEVTVGMAKGARTMLTHVVQNPVLVQVKVDGGVVTCLEIEERDDTKTLLTF